MKWKCEVEYRRKRYELVEGRKLIDACAECAFHKNGGKCSIPAGFPTCSIEIVYPRDGSGRIAFDQDFSRVWKAVEK